MSAFWLDEAIAEHSPRMAMGTAEAAIAARSLWSAIETRLCSLALYRPAKRLAVSPPRFSDERCVIEFRELAPGEKLEPEACGWTIYGPFPDGLPRPPGEVHAGVGLPLFAASCGDRPPLS